jgi:protein-tyrosine sulfotransferase
VPRLAVAAVPAAAREAGTAAVPGARAAPARDDPVFVLCAGRSGSTLLRFLLDSHPVLACPPETRIGWLCTQMVSAWSSAARGEAAGEAAVPPPEVIAGLRASFGPLIAACLARAGKERFCDKSLGSAMHSGLLRQVWPQARFIALYRHPMDVIGSGIEASPWGLAGYGFESYAAASPGNSVAALARYWAEYTAQIVAAEERLGECCLRLRYEDLVAAPEAEAGRVFAFLGVEAVPGITQAMFARRRRRAGPGDHKIWQTSRITADSVGRGWNVPAGRIPPPLLAEVNRLAAVLGYLPVTAAWGKGGKPDDVRAGR